MKKLIKLLTIIFTVSIIVVGCGTDQPNKVIPKDKIEDVANSGIRDQSQWKEYTNSRFGFSISFPKEWYKGKVSQNDDGIVLNVDNSNFDIRAYASHYLEDFSKPYKNLDKEGFKKEDIELNQGQVATLITGEERDIKKGDTAVYEMVLISQNIEYHFYAKVSKEYAQEYEDVILNVIRTFNLDVEGEEKSQ